MSSFQHDGLRGGVWHGVIAGASRPAPLALVHRGERIAPVDLTQTPDGNAWQVAATLPLDRLTDGASTFLLVEDGEDGQLANDTAIIARLPVIAGAEINSDLQAELALMRAELDLLLREFRRQSTASASAIGQLAKQADLDAAIAAAQEAGRIADSAKWAAEDAARTAGEALHAAQEATAAISRNDSDSHSGEQTDHDQGHDSGDEWQSEAESEAGPQTDSASIPRPPA